MEANNTAPAEVSFEILAKILNSFFTTKSTIDSIDVFNISNIKTDIIVAIKITKLLRLILSKKPIIKLANAKIN